MARLREGCLGRIRQRWVVFGFIGKDERKPAGGVTAPLLKGDMQVKHDCKALVAASSEAARQNGFSTTSNTIPIITSVGISLAIR
jgi:hypothetical protein